MEIVLSSASHHALLFAFITREILKADEEKGKLAVTEAVRHYGLQRGKRMALRAVRDGNPLNGLTYEMYSEWKCFPGQVDCSVESRDGCLRIRYGRCPWHTEWKHSGMMEIGRYYCDYVDAAILEGFGISDGGIVCTRTDGMPTCDIVFRGDHYNSSSQEEMEKKKEQLGDRAKMPWQYHVGHLYQCLRDSVCKYFEGNADELIETAMKNYASQFGEEAAALVLEYADLDYDSVTDY